MKYIVTADWHLRNDRPLCRKDEDWIQAQREMIAEIVSFANDEGAAIVVAGDLFNTAIVPARINTLFLSEIRKCNQKVYVLGGNHSLKYHQENLADDSSIGLLKYVEGNVVYLEAEEHRENGRFEHVAVLDEGVYVIHTLCFKEPGDIPFGANATHASALFEKYPEAKWIFLGDNHTFFHYIDLERWAINPGTPIIQNASMIDYKPRAWCIDTITEECKEFFLHNDISLLSTDHLVEKQERDARIEAFIEVVKTGGAVSLSFEDNIRNALPTLPLEVQGVIQELFAESVEE